MRIRSQENNAATILKLTNSAIFDFYRSAGGTGRRRVRSLSPAAKKRISDAMRRTWAERKRKMKAA